MYRRADSSTRWQQITVSAERESQYLENIYTRTHILEKPCIPSSSSLWNYLKHEIRSSATLGLFRSKLNEKTRPLKTFKIYGNTLFCHFLVCDQHCAISVAMSVSLALSHMRNIGLFQTERVCRRQFQI